ncbi:MAG: hypothetical protein OJF59_001597 [Cytophagales bacterium]|jgi:outer membrane protein OmpA-like peptidoglycan-associated protein|nr:OmpA family protein [Bacteroidota bacterium]MBS1980526.1 OmpA family protein [Bacteroidota bacterium]WHZ07844.1 MAG: hypothetical protein OJF59_001597 [Cytophagales bacterium]
MLLENVKIFCSLAVALGLLFSCTSKTKNEQPVSKKDSVVIVPKPEPKNDRLPSVASTEKIESKPAISPKEKKIETNPIEKVEPKKEPVALPQVPAKEPDVIKPTSLPPTETPVVKKEPDKITPPKTDSSASKKVPPKGKPFYFRVVSKADGKELFGNLQLQEAGSNQYRLVRSGQVIYIDQPANSRGAFNLSAMLAGFRQSSLIFLYNNPPIETGPKNESIITLELDKARAGDYVDFNNVHFFANTSIMRPVSQGELDELVNLLKENPRYKIKIYGYCNGKQDRDAYTLGTSVTYFSMDYKNNQHGKISSKKLSEARAESVKGYLASQGINAQRIFTKGEGGRVPIYPEEGNLAQYNDRVEIEFVKN